MRKIDTGRRRCRQCRCHCLRIADTVTRLRHSHWSRTKSANSIHTPRRNMEETKLSSDGRRDRGTEVDEGGSSAAGHGAGRRGDVGHSTQGRRGDLNTHRGEAMRVQTVYCVSTTDALRKQRLDFGGPAAFRSATKVAPPTMATHPALALAVATADGDGKGSGNICWHSQAERQELIQPAFPKVVPHQAKACQEGSPEPAHSPMVPSQD